MSRNGAVLLLLSLFAGAAGGVASSFALRGAEPPAPIPGPDRAEDPADRTSERLDRFAEALGEIRLELSALRARIERAEREPVRPASGGEDDGDPPPPRGEAPPEEIATPAGEPKGPAKPLVRVRSPRAEVLMSMAEEKRWAKIREDLALDNWQAEEVRRASDDLLAEIRDFALLRERSGDAAVDPETVLAAFERSRDRVGRALSEDQLRRFDTEGFGEAVGLGREPPDLGAAFSYPRRPREQR